MLSRRRLPRILSNPALWPPERGETGDRGDTGATGPAGPGNISTGSASTTAVLLAGASVDLVVTISPAFANATYTALPTLSSASISLLGTLIVGKKSQTASTVTVTLKNTGLVSIALGQTVEVIAYKG